jgi:PTH1 family peptidyl-tRNA hydrolase
VEREREPQSGKPGGEDLFIVGLGNPGRRYEQTRHNVGARVVSRLWKTRSSGGTSRGHRCEYRLGAAGGRRVVMVRPVSYMNESGPPVAELLRAFGGAAAAMLVIHDDLDLPLGALRFRRGGSSGGHRGVASIIEALGDDTFPRLKIGVGRPGETGKDVVDFVLSPPPAEEASELSAVEGTAADAAWLWVTQGIEYCMNRFNRKAVGAEEA